MKRFDSTADAIRQSQALERLQSLKDGTLVPIPTEFIRLSRNIRTEDIDKKADDFRQLMASIREVGLLHSPVVTIVGEELVCVAGHRRIAAMMELGFDKVPCLLRHFSELSHKDVAQFVENMARKNLHPLDVARQLQVLREQGYSQTKLQEMLGRDRKTIGRFQKMAAWPEEVRSLIFQHANRLKTGFLLQLASRDMAPEALVQAIRIKAGLVKKIPGPKPAAFNKPILGGKELAEKTRRYFHAKNYSESERTIILRALIDLGLLGDGILDPMPSENKLVAAVTTPEPVPVPVSVVATPAKAKAEVRAPEPARKGATSKASVAAKAKKPSAPVKDRRAARR